MIVVRFFAELRMTKKNCSERQAKMLGTAIACVFDNLCACFLKQNYLFHKVNTQSSSHLPGEFPGQGKNNLHKRSKAILFHRAERRLWRRLQMKPLI